MRHILALSLLLSSLTGFANDPRTNAKVVSVPCDMIALNKAYVQIVQRHRSQAYGRPVVTRFDRNMLHHTFVHNMAMEQTDSLYHDDLTFNAEMVGAILDIEQYRNDPVKLAEYIFSRFDKSKAGHHETQMNMNNVYISITCTSRYFAVRMNSRPDGYERPVAVMVEKIITKKEPAN